LSAASHRPATCVSLRYLRGGRVRGGAERGPLQRCRTRCAAVTAGARRGAIIAGRGPPNRSLFARARLCGSVQSALTVSFVGFDLRWTAVTYCVRIVTETGRIDASRTYADGTALLPIAAAHKFEAGKRAPP
jgi:hypothetical protein